MQTSRVPISKAKIKNAFKGIAPLRWKSSNTDSETQIPKQIGTNGTGLGTVAVELAGNLQRRQVIVADLALQFPLGDADLLKMPTLMQRNGALCINFLQSIFKQQWPLPELSDWLLKATQAGRAGEQTWSEKAGLFVGYRIDLMEPATVAVSHLQVKVGASLEVCRDLDADQLWTIPIEWQSAVVNLYRYGNGLVPVSEIWPFFKDNGFSVAETECAIDLYVAC